VTKENFLKENWVLIFRVVLLWSLRY